MASQSGQTILNGKYRILKLIGEGGMARVWLAEEPGFGGRQVAIKEPLTDQLREQERQEIEVRFRQEVRLAPQLDQARVPNVVRTYTVEQLPGGTPLLVMEYLPGGSLDKLIAAHPHGLPVERAITITKDVLQALAGFHRLPGAPIHRDVKPENILLDSQGRAYLSDLGLAQLPGMSGRSQLRGGPHPGTPLYMAPEQGRSPDPLTPAADLYALGCVLFEMLTGKPYKRVRPGTKVGALRPGLPTWLDVVLTRVLAEDPWDRYQSAEEMAIALSESLERRTHPQLPGPKPVPVLIGLAGGILCLGIVAVVLMGILGGGKATPSPATRMVEVTHGPESSPTPTSSMATAVATTWTTDTPTKTPALLPQATSAAAPRPTSTSTLEPTSTPKPEPTQSPKPEPTLTPKIEAKIAFSAQKANAEPDIYVMDPDGTNVVQLTFDSGYDSGPDWSPDGQYLAFHSNRNGNYDLFLMSRGGETATMKQLTAHPANDYDASWSPDGTQIVFMSDRTGNREIFVMNSDGSNIRQLTNTASSACSPTCERQPAWSPSGQIIAFESGRSGKTQIYVMAPSGHDQHAITDSEGLNFSPKWSSGGLIAFASTRDPGNKENKWPEIYTSDLSGGNQVRLTSNTADDEAPAWSPDGQWIVFASKRDSCFNQRDDGDCDWNLYVMRADGTGTQRLTNTPNLSEYNPVWWGP